MRYDPKVDLSYVAGFFDGEGCVRVARNGGRGFTLSAQITQNEHATSTALFAELKDTFGGSISKQTALRTKLNWQVTGQNALGFLSAILPYLRLKGDQARVAVDWFSKREPVTRSATGRIVQRSDRQFAIDLAVHDRLRAMKKE